MAEISKTKILWTDDYRVYNELEDAREIVFQTDFGKIDIKIPKGGPHKGKLVVSCDNVLRIYPRAANQIIIEETKP